MANLEGRWGDEGKGKAMRAREDGEREYYVYYTY